MKTKTVVKKRVIKAKPEDKVGRVMEEFKQGKLKTPQGKTVTSREQAIAIALNEAGLSNKSLTKAEVINKIRVLKSMAEKMLKKEMAKEENIDKKIIDFFTANPAPMDSAVHAFAEKNGIAPDELESKIYALVGSILAGGKSKGFAGKYDPEQLQKGIETELEHTDNRYVAEKIAKDHLAEHPDYYTKLLAAGL